MMESTFFDELDLPFVEILLFCKWSAVYHIISKLMHILSEGKEDIQIPLKCFLL